MSYDIFVSSSALTLDDTEIFHILNEVAETPNKDNCAIAIYFLPKHELLSVKESFGLYSYSVGSIYADILEKYGYFWQGTEDGKLIKKFNDIQERMQEVRDNEYERGI